MGTLKIYISSSEKGLTLARKLQYHLNNSGFTSATIWSEWRDEASSTVIEMLEKAIAEFDFAVIILTREDMVYQKNGDEDIPQARDNCFYEAGLFMGSLKRDRCFLVSSVKAKGLPEDIRGIRLWSFEPPTDLTDETMCDEKMRTPASKILEYVQSKGAKQSSKPFPILPADIVFERESKLNKDQVVVSAAMPSGVDKFERACQIKQNMDKNIIYRYFFCADVDGAIRICQLLQNILLAKIINEQDRDKFDNFQFRIDELNKKKDEVLSILWDICYFDRLGISFFETPPSFEFILHNAKDKDEAKAYLKNEEDYIEWFKGPEANNLWKGLEKCCLNKPPHAVFLDTHCLLVRNKPIKEKLNEEINKHFGDIADQVKNLCHNGFILSFELGKGVGIAENDTIVGTESQTNATVSWIKLTRGSWAEGNAAGRLILKNQTEDKTFKNENLIVVGKDTTVRAKANP